MHPRVLALDYGDRRIGVAASTALGTAHPVGVIQNDSIEEVLDLIDHLVEDKDIAEIVVGLPINMDGTQGPRARIAIAFAETVAKRTGLPVFGQDERLTTVEANRVLAEAGIPPRKRKDKLDAIAALRILEAYLEEREDDDHHTYDASS